MRQLLIFFLSLCLFAGSLAATLGTVAWRDWELRGYVDPTQNQELPFATSKPGVNVELLQYDEHRMRAQLAHIEAAGFRWLRQSLAWDSIEPRRGLLDWSGWDRLMRTLRDFPHLELVAVLQHSPAWARSPSAPGTLRSAPPQSPADFANFAHAFAARYGDDIHHYQIWDEPNLSDAWGGIPPHPADYVALLAAAHAAILQADTDASIIAAGLAPTTETGGQNISDIRYLRSMYAQGAAAYMDIVAAKPYGFSVSPLDRTVDESVLNFSRIVALREIMLEYGDGKKALWASHYGWNSLPSGWSGAPSIWGQVSAEQQMRYTLQALDRAHREWPWLGVMFLHHWQPPTTPDDPQQGFALVQPDGSDSLLLQALQSYPYPEQAENGLFHARSEFARYSGVWEFSPLGADIGWLNESDSQLSFDFAGSDIAMLLREDDYIAFLYPQVDGKASNATQRDSSGNPYIFLRSDSRQPELNLVPISVDLPLSTHTLQLIADRGWDRWAIAGYAVSSGDLARPFQQQIAVGLAASVLSALLLLRCIWSFPLRRWLALLRPLLQGINAVQHLLLSALTSFFLMLALLLTWGTPRASLLAREDVNLLLALLTGGLLFLSPSFLLSLLLAFALFLLLFHRLETGLILTLLWAPFFLFPVQLYSYALPMVELILLLTATAGFVRALAAWGKARQMGGSALPDLSLWRLAARLTVIDGALALLALLATLSLLWAEHPETAWTELRTLIAEPLLFYILLRSLQPNRETLLRLCGAILLAGMIVSLLGLAQYLLLQSGIRAEDGVLRLQSVYGSPNNVALLLGRSIPLAVAFLLAKLERRWRWLAAGSLLVMLPAMFLTQSVGALLLGIPAALALIFLLHLQRRALPYLAAGALLAGATFALLTRLSARFANILDFSSGTNFFRLRLWESSVAVLRDHPLTGIGLDQFLYHVGGTYLKPDAIWDRDQSHPHNVILDFWTRLGLLGLLAFIVIQLHFWRTMHALLLPSRRQDGAVYAMALGLAGSMAALLAHGMIDNSVFVIDLAYIFMFQLACALSLRELH